MNRDEISEQLQIFMLHYRFHDKFKEELQNLLENDLNGKEKKFFKSMYTQLSYIDNFGRAIDQVDGHEKLKWFDDEFYSIHITGNQFNVRFLMYFNEYDEPLFLCAFYERAKKKRTDYSRYKEPAKKRLSALLKEEEDE